MENRNLFPAIQGSWEDVIADMEATAEEYRRSGWEAIELHPGDVTPLAPDEVDETYGLDVLLPGDEFEALRRTIAGGDVAFDSYKVYRAREGDVVFLVVAMEDTSSELAVVYPAYYGVQQSSEMFEAADERGKLFSHLRKLEPGTEVTFEHDDPEPFFPPEAADEGGADAGENADGN